MVSRSLTAPNTAVPPEIMRNRYVLPAFRDIDLELVRGDPTKLVAFEFELLLDPALFEPIVIEDDDVAIKLSFEKAAEHHDFAR